MIKPNYFMKKGGRAYGKGLMDRNKKKTMRAPTRKTEKSRIERRGPLLKRRPLPGHPEKPRNIASRDLARKQTAWRGQRVPKETAPSSEVSPR